MLSTVLPGVPACQTDANLAVMVTRESLAGFHISSPYLGVGQCEGVPLPSSGQGRWSCRVQDREVLGCTAGGTAGPGGAGCSARLVPEPSTSLTLQPLHCQRPCRGEPASSSPPTTDRKSPPLHTKHPHPSRLPPKSRNREPPLPQVSLEGREGSCILPHHPRPRWAASLIHPDGRDGAGWTRGRLLDAWRVARGSVSESLGRWLPVGAFLHSQCPHTDQTSAG